MVSDADRFQALRHEFQESHARFDTTLPCLYAMTDQEREKYRDPMDRDSYVFGFVPLCDKVCGDPREYGYWIVGRKRWREFSYEVACTEFDRLASLAGSMLPQHILDRLPNYSPNVAGMWLAVLWHLNPLPNDLGSIATDGPPNGIILFGGESPFAISVWAIEQLGLNTDTPAWPGEVRQPPAEAKPVKPKRSTLPLEAHAKLVAALSAHHGFDGDSCTNYEPIGSNELCRLARVRSNATGSRFFKREFDGLDKYRAACTNNADLILRLRLLRGEVKPRDIPTYGRTPPGQGRDDDE